MKRLWQLSIFIIGVVLVIGSSLGVANGEMAKLRWVLEGYPAESRAVDFLSLRLFQNSAEEPLDLSLSKLVDDSGNEFPREMLVLQTPYDSAWQSWDSIYSQRRVVATNDAYADLELGIQYNSPVRAGIYRGRFYSKQGIELPVEIVVKPYTKVSVEPQEVFINIASGPDTYYGDEPVTIRVEANHGNWLVQLSSSGLFNEEDLLRAQESFNTESLVTPLKILFVKEELATEKLQIWGSDYDWGASFRFKLMTEVDWNHRAGSYVGVVRVEVLVNE